MAGKLNEVTTDGRRGAFIQVTAGGLRWEVRADPADPALARILESPESAFRDRSSILKSGRSSIVARVSPFVVKRFNQKRPLNRLLDRIRGDRGHRNLALSAELETIGIPTPRAVAAAPRRTLGLVACSYLVMEELRGARTLLVWLHEGGEARVLEQIGAILARLHAAGWSHRDLKATNLLVDSGGRPHLVDLDGVRRRRPTIRRRAADLQRLFRDLSTDRGGSKAWIDAIFEGYFQHAPRTLEAGLRRELTFAAAKGACENH